MSDILIIGEPEMTEGFSMAGARVDATRDPERVEWSVRESLLARAPAVVVITEELYEKIPEKLRLQAEKSTRPMFITLPRPAPWEILEERDTLIHRIIRRAIGYRIKIKR